MALHRQADRTATTALFPIIPAVKTAIYYGFLTDHTKIIRRLARATVLLERATQYESANLVEAFATGYGGSKAVKYHNRAYHKKHPSTRERGPDEPAAPGALAYMATFLRFMRLCDEMEDQECRNHDDPFSKARQMLDSALTILQLADANRASGLKRVIGLVHFPAPAANGT